MFKLYILILLSIININFSFGLTESNPAAIRQVTITKDNVILSLQVIDKGFAATRCICPEASLSYNVDKNNGKFDVVVDFDWLNSQIPGLIGDKDYLPNLFSKHNKILVIYDAEFLFTPGKKLGSYKTISLDGGAIAKAQYTKLPGDRYTLEAPQGHLYPSTIKKDKPKTKVKPDIFIREDNPAVILSAEVIDDNVHLILQVVNYQLSAVRCICKESTFVSMVNNNNGEFSAVMSLKQFTKYLPEIAENTNLLYDLYEENSEAFAFVGGLKIEAEDLSTITKVSVIKTSVLQAVQFNRAETDAFNFSGPYDKNVYHTDEDSEISEPGFFDIIK
jgi:hypothetical protein